MVIAPLGLTEPWSWALVPRACVAPPVLTSGSPGCVSNAGALGAATHLARLVPQHRMRAMVYTAEPATADELYRYGSVLRVVEPDELRAAARDVAGQIAAKSGTIIRRAKESLNGIDPVDVKRSYRFEQGFTFELTLAGVADEARQAFVEKRDAKFSQ